MRISHGSKRFRTTYSRFDICSVVVCLLPLCQTAQTHTSMPHGRLAYSVFVAVQDALLFRTLRFASRLLQRQKHAAAQDLAANGCRTYVSISSHMPYRAVAAEQRRLQAAQRKRTAPGAWKGRLGLLTQQLWADGHPAAAEVAALLGFADQINSIPGFFEPALLEVQMIVSHSWSWQDRLVSQLLQRSPRWVRGSSDILCDFGPMLLEVKVSAYSRVRAGLASNSPLLTRRHPGLL